MRKATLSSLFRLILLSLLAAEPSFAKPPASSTNLAEPSDKELNRGLNAGATCLDYTLDILSLVDNDHRVFWKQMDCIRVHVTNNPFLFKYTLEFNEQVIKEDDPLSAFGGKFGLKVSNVSSTSSAGTQHTINNDTNSNLNTQLNSVSDATHEALAKIDAQPVTPETKGFLSLQVQNFSKDLASPRVAASPTTKLDFYKEQVDKARISDAQKAQVKDSLTDVANAGTLASPPPSSKLDSLTDGDGHIQKMMTLITSEYRKFSRDVQGRLKVLRDPTESLDEVKRVAEKLVNDSNQEMACLNDAIFDAGYTRLLGCPENVNSDSPGASVSQPTDAAAVCTNPTNPTLVCQLVKFAHDVQPLHEDIEKALPAPAASDLMNTLHSASQDVALQACTYQAFSASEIDSIRTGLIAPLNSVLSDGFAFGYQYPKVAKKREGPFTDPTSVTMTLKRDTVSPFTTASGDPALVDLTTSSFECAGDPEDLVTNGSSYSKLADFFSEKPPKPAKGAAGASASTQSANLYMRNPNKPVLKGKTTSTTAGSGADSASGKNGTATKPSTSDANTIVLPQSWVFGKPRLVLSGGEGIALLTKQEFQRSMTISSGTTETVVGLKTNTRVRNTPMLYGHALIPWFDRRHDPDAWFATFGVTANSDSKGTDPEFLFGLSRSFVQQRFFVTAGAYLGERQKLDGGLYVGEVIPSTFTGDLPVTKSYHTGFAFGISYRFASTKTAQDNAKQTSGGSNTKGK